MTVSTLLIEGSFPELAEELAQYFDSIEDTGVLKEIEPLLQETRENTDSDQARTQDEILKKLVQKAPILNNVSEREFTAAYNLLIHLSLTSSIQEGLFSRLCKYLSEQPVIPSSPYGNALAISTLTTIFNVLPLTSEARYHVFLAILKVIKSTSSAQAFEALIPQLEQNVPNWLSAWQLDAEDAQSLHTAIAEVAQSQGHSDLGYAYLLKALETVPEAEASNEPSRTLAKRVLTTALTNPSVVDFTPLIASAAIQSLRKTDADLVELLEIFSSDGYAEYKEFVADHKLADIGLDESSEEILSTKIRLLTLASIAAASPNRSVPYASIVSALQIDEVEVEIWVIDTIRAGLVEGKLSQIKQEFLVQRATYRVFGEKQWAEIQNRLMIWRRSLQNVLETVRSERERFAKEGVNGYEEKTMGYDNRRGGGNRRQRDVDAATD